jgi:hypothetical protein
MTWLAFSGLVWVALALSLAVVMGRGIRQADQREQVAAWATQVDQFVQGLEQPPLAVSTPAARQSPH